MTFVNAQEMRIKNPETFYAPPKEELDAIKEGNFVKVCAGNERFWCRVDSINEDKLKGTVDNELVHVDQHGLKFGDKIEFGKEHVYDIIPE